jgi:formylglycine-generating enzyme required for sulfatase activity
MNEPLLKALAVLLLTARSATSPLAADPPPLAKSPLDTEQVKELQQQWAKHIGKEPVYTNSIGMNMVLLPPGEFTMGRTEEQFDKLLDVVKNDPQMKKNYMGMVTWSMLMMPAHRVRITNPFYMGATEVTVGQFRRFFHPEGDGDGVTAWILDFGCRVVINLP